MELLDLLRLPEARQLTDLDDPRTTELHWRIIRSKEFLRRLYLEWYESFRDLIADITAPRAVVELGSGAGFLKDVIPDAITSEVLAISGVDLRCSALELPFASGAVDAFLMLDALHHLPDAGAFLAEASRCLAPGGRVVMIEPANTAWGGWVWQHLHHEAFDPSAGWELSGSGPLSDANGAIPWIVFVRDRDRFQSEFPELELKHLSAHTPIRYLLSGGVSMRSLVPAVSFGPLRALERLAAPFSSWTGMFYTIELRKAGPGRRG